MKFSEMTKKERVEAALSLKETDRVPVFDILFSDACIEYFTGRKAPVGEEGLKLKCQAISRMLDMTRAADVAPIVPGDTIDEDGFVTKMDRWLYLGIEKRPFADEEGAVEWLKKANSRMEKDIKNLDLTTYVKNFREEFNKVQNYLGDDTVILIRQSGTGLDDVRHKLGLEIFSYLSIDNPELISEYLELHTEREVKIIHAIADRTLSPCALTFGDIAIKNTLMHAPDWLRREFFPRIKRLNDAYHAHDIKCLFHSDGYLMDIMDSLIETGIDGINPIETTAGMQLSVVKKLYGDKIFITGGIDMSQLLSYGTPEEVYEVSIKAIETASPGYFIGSTTEIDNSARLENVLAMLSAAGVVLK